MDDNEWELQPRGATSVDWDRDARDKLRQRFVFRAKKRTLRQKMRYTLFKSEYSWIFEVVVSVVSIAWVATYIAGTYFIYSTGYPDWLQAVDYVLATFFAIVWFLRWICTNRPVMYLILPYSILDYLTIIPVYFTFAGTAFLRVISILRIFRVLRPLKAITSAVVRQFFKLCFSLLALMFTAAALFLAVEPDSFVNFHTALYFSVVTMTTLGYGDFSPKTDVGRFCTVALIIASTIVVPLQAYLLSRVISAKKSQHEGSYLPEKGVSPVILVADSTVETAKISSFMEEFFKRYGTADNKFEVVLLTADEPRPEVIKLHNADYQGKMRFFLGKASQREALERIKIEEAKAVVILTNDEGDPDSLDKDAALQALAVKTLAKRVPVFVMARKPENDALIEAAGRFVYTLSYDEIRLGILAHTMIAPGFSTFLLNLMTTQSVRDESESGLYHSLWEYAYGASHEIYFGEISRNFVGSKFSDAAAAIYEETYSILIGLVGERSIELNPPGNTTLYGNETGIFIADTFIVEGEMHAIKEDKSGQSPRRLSAEFVGRDRESTSDNSIMGPVITYRNPITAATVKDTEWLSKRFHVAVFRRSIDDLVIQDAKKRLFGHFVLIGNLDCWEHVVAPLRSVVLPNVRPVLILTESMPSESELQLLALFPDVYVMLGSGLSIADYKRAHISKAVRVAVLRSGSSATADRDCLLVRNLLRRTYKNLDLIFELHDPSGLGILHRKEQSNPLLYSQVRTGEVCLSSMATRILSQSVCNTFMMDVLQQLALWTISVDSDEDEPSSLETNLFLMDIPKKFVGLPFNTLFKSYISKRGIIVVGLYRLHDGKPLRFVMTAPLPQTLIEEADQMYVLSRKAAAQ